MSQSGLLVNRTSVQAIRGLDWPGAASARCQRTGGRFLWRWAASGHGWLVWPKELTTNREPRDPPLWAGVLGGAAIGLLSGLTGTGGGIFLSPLLLFVGWSATKSASGVAAVFILCNSVAGLMGNVAIVKALPPNLPIYAAAVLAGAVAGTTFGINFAVPAILKALGLVLVVAGFKLIGVY
jgi:uncharacterized protein